MYDPPYAFNIVYVLEHCNFLTKPHPITPFFSFYDLFLYVYYMD